MGLILYHIKYILLQSICFLAKQMHCGIVVAFGDQEEQPKPQRDTISNKFQLALKPVAYKQQLPSYLIKNS